MFKIQIGLFQFRVTDSGLKNTSVTFCSLASEVFCGLVGKCMFIYLDDIVVYLESKNQHLNNLKRVLEKLQSDG